MDFTIYGTLHWKSIRLSPTNREKNQKKERRNKIELIYSQLEIYPFDELSARKYSIIRTQLEKNGLVISERDLQIASIAMANKLIVVTHNVKEFKRIEKLDIEDWAKTG